MHRLQAAGFAMDTRRQQRLLLVLQQQGGKHIGQVANLKYSLAPFVVSSAAEQERFYQFFDNYLLDCEKGGGVWEEILGGFSAMESSETIDIGEDLSAAEKNISYSLETVNPKSSAQVDEEGNKSSISGLIRQQHTTPSINEVNKYNASDLDGPQSEASSTKNDNNPKISDLEGSQSNTSSIGVEYKSQSIHTDHQAAQSYEELAAAHPMFDKEPYFIPYTSPDSHIVCPPDFFRMAELLRRREVGERRDLDIEASVRTTVVGGGYPVLVEKQGAQARDYLFLIERGGILDQQGRLFERLGAFFVREEAPLYVYYHDGGFKTFWNGEYPDGVSINFLQKQYDNYHLVLIGSGHGLIDLRRPLPALRISLLAQLLNWKKAIFLTPLPVSAWSTPEVLLYRHWPLYPADVAGIEAGLQNLVTLESYEPVPYILWEKDQAALRQDCDPRFRSWESVADHRDFLANDVKAFQWLCGLAVCVAPDFALTVAIGKKLGIEVTHDRLLRLSRIPWLNRNEPDEDLRLKLLAELTPEEERLAREAVTDVLEEIRDQVANSFAFTEWETNVAINRFALDPSHSEKRQLLRELLLLGLFSGSQKLELDGLAQRRFGMKGIEEHLKLSIPEMVLVETANFEMGCTEQHDCWSFEKPSHLVTLSSYYIGKYPVTQGQWEEVMGKNPSYFLGFDHCPVECVSWEDVQLFLYRLNLLTGQNYRLPTEAEWEFAARGGSRNQSYKYAGGKNIDDVAWHKDNAGGKTQNVGTKMHNELGLYDMSGNVLEWCQDYFGAYPSSAQINPRGPYTGPYRVVRGGSWNSDRSLCRVSYRFGMAPGLRRDDIGFRLARSL
jgi:formylglycine-generating enzyme required for sulfatase activity